jgi:pumilio homology domain family member 6
VQTALKYGTPTDRSAIIEELKGRAVELSKSHYGHFLVQKMLKHALPLCTKPVQWSSVD